MTSSTGDHADRPECSTAEYRLVSDATWKLLLLVAGQRRKGLLPTGPVGYYLDDQQDLQKCDYLAAYAALILQPDQTFAPGPALSETEQVFTELYCPLLGASPDRPVVVGHLGQSLDSRIATPSGDSFYVTGAMNLQHIHRIRALCDAIVVGASTAQTDNPRLTTRLVSGPNPVRVVIDPNGRLKAPLNLFDDGQAPTVVVQGRRTEKQAANVTTLRIDAATDKLPPLAIRNALVQKGWPALFIEGGGVTVSRWLNDNALTHLQLACAPVLVGPGRAAIQAPAIDTMRHALRPSYRLYQMGEDLLFDFDLSQSSDIDQSTSTVFRRLA